jgi:7-cyano-7-deazaguanine synthase in queuosine biosynthesis
MSQSRNNRPFARVAAIERGARSSRGALSCVIGRELVIDAEVLSSYCFKELSPRVDDLVLLAGVIAFADRCVPRRTSEAWGRDFEVSVPVHHPGFWRKASVLDALVDALELVTGDCWHFEFYQRKTAVKVRAQAPLSLTHGSPPIVMPYSDGLDSLAGARLVSAREPDSALILVTSGTRKDNDKPWREKHLIGRRHRVAVPFRISDKNAARRFREPTYRSRGFVYSILAGIAAHLSGGSRVIISESGQGALGPWLAPVGNEAPDVRTHPTFTRRIATLLEAVLGIKLVFEHPSLWLTKGQTLLSLAGVNDDDAWSRTRSCARDARQLHFNGSLLQCGVCASCLLRRQSLHAAGLHEIGDTYLWQDLAASSLQ